MGTGMLVGLNVAVNSFIGSLLAWWVYLSCQVPCASLTLSGASSVPSWSLMELLMAQKPPNQVIDHTTPSPMISSALLIQVQDTGYFGLQ